MGSSLLEGIFVDPPPFNEALSGVFGSVSLVAWICLLLPQLITNYKSKSAEALSMPFLFIWLAGDICNLSGAFLTSLSPTAIILGSYFIVADVTLISQCLYYNAKSKLRNERNSRRRASIGSDSSEESPLLARRRSSSIGLPGSHRHSGHHEESGLEPIRKVITGEDDTPDSNPWLHNTLSVLAIYAVGFLGWLVSYRYGMWDKEPAPDVPSGDADTYMYIGSGLGYLSALCYLCARLPQIYKNWQEKSCEGLALLFFLLSLTGNSTYGLSLLAYSQKREDLIKAIPWLLGSLGTIVEDSIIFVQFRLYAAPRRRT